MNEGMDGEKNELIGKWSGENQAVQEKWCKNKLNERV